MRGLKIVGANNFYFLVFKYFVYREAIKCFLSDTTKNFLLCNAA